MYQGERDLSCSHQEQKLQYGMQDREIGAKFDSRLKTCEKRPLLCDRSSSVSLKFSASFTHFLVLWEQKGTRCAKNWKKNKSFPHQGSNRNPSDYETDALPIAPRGVVRKVRYRLATSTSRLLANARLALRLLIFWRYLMPLL